MAHPEHGLVSVLQEFLWSNPHRREHKASLLAQLRETVLFWCSVASDKKRLGLTYRKVVENAVKKPFETVLEMLNPYDEKGEHHPEIIQFSSQQIQHQVTVPIVIVNDGVGLCYTLQLTRWESMEMLPTCPLLQDLRNRFHVDADEVFQQHTEQALNQATRLVHSQEKANGSECNYFLTWSIHDAYGCSLEGKDLLEIKGASASGAMTVGLFHLLNNTYPDPGVMHLGAITALGSLDAVSGVSTKVEGILMAKYEVNGDSPLNWIDTVVVTANETRDNTLSNYSEATKAHDDFVEACREHGGIDADNEYHVTGFRILPSGEHLSKYAVIQSLLTEKYVLYLIELCNAAGIDLEQYGSGENSSYNSHFRKLLNRKLLKMDKGGISNAFSEGIIHDSEKMCRIYGHAAQIGDVDFESDNADIFKVELYTEALQLLKYNGCHIIFGESGIGKTFIAKKLTGVIALGIISGLSTRLTSVLREPIVALYDSTSSNYDEDVTGFIAAAKKMCENEKVNSVEQTYFELMRLYGYKLEKSDIVVIRDDMDVIPQWDKRSTEEFNNFEKLLPFRVLYFAHIRSIPKAIKLFPTAKFYVIPRMSTQEQMAMLDVQMFDMENCGDSEAKMFLTSNRIIKSLCNHPRNLKNYCENISSKLSIIGNTAFEQIAKIVSGFFESPETYQKITDNKHVDYLIENGATVTAAWITELILFSNYNSLEEDALQESLLENTFDQIRLEGNISGELFEQGLTWDDFRRFLVSINFIYVREKTLGIAYYGFSHKPMLGFLIAISLLMNQSGSERLLVKTSDVSTQPLQIYPLGTFGAKGTRQLELMPSNSSRFFPVWRDSLLFYAAMTGKATEEITFLLQKKDDVFHSNLRLCYALCAIAPKTSIELSHPLANEILTTFADESLKKGGHGSLFIETFSVEHTNEHLVSCVCEQVESICDEEAFVPFPFAMVYACVAPKRYAGFAEQQLQIGKLSNDGIVNLCIGLKSSHCDESLDLIHEILKMNAGKAVLKNALLAIKERASEKSLPFLQDLLNTGKAHADILVDIMDVSKSILGQGFWRVDENKYRFETLGGLAAIGILKMEHSGVFYDAYLKKCYQQRFSNERNAIKQTKFALMGLECADVGFDVSLVSYFATDQRDFRIRIAAVSALGKAKENELYPFIKGIFENDSHCKVRRAAFRMLILMNGHILEKECNHIIQSSGDRVIRQRVSTVFGEYSFVDSIKLLIDRVNIEKDAVVKSGLYWSLSRLDPDYFSLNMKSFLEREQDMIVIRGILMSIGNVNSPDAVRLAQEYFPYMMWSLTEKEKAKLFDELLDILVTIPEHVSPDWLVENYCIYRSASFFEMGEKVASILRSKGMVLFFESSVQ